MDVGISGFGECVAIALMAAVTYRLGIDALRGWAPCLIALISLAVLLRWKVNPAWVVLGGGVAGFGRSINSFDPLIRFLFAYDNSFVVNV